MILYSILLAGFAGLVVLVSLTRSAERYIGWRYLFRRRSSRAIVLLTVVLGVAAATLPALFLLVKWRAGSFAPGLLAILAVPTLILFITVLVLNFFSVFTTVSTTGVVCGVATLVVVLSVTSGFQEEFKTKVLGANAHIIVMKYGLDFSEYREVIKKAEALPHVQAAAPFLFQEMLISHGANRSGALVKGIVPGVSTRVLDVSHWMLDNVDVNVLDRALAPSDGGPPLPGILVGREMQKKLRVKVGDRVRVVSPLGDLDPALWNTDGKMPKAREFRVGGIFYSGFDEYDRRLVCVSLKEGQAFLEGGDVVTGVELKVDDVDDSDLVSAELDRTLKGAYRTIDWRDLNHNLFTALKMQKVALTILMTLIVLVAAFGIVATLTMLVIDKTREIAILKSIGMRGSSVERVFLTAGLTIGALGTVAGIGLGLMVCFIVSHYGYHLDPRVYLIDRLPVTVHVGEVLLTALITMAVCYVATIYPSQRASRLKPVEGLRAD